MKKTALEKELDALRRKEERYLKKCGEKKVSAINRMLEEKVPQKLQDTLNLAFSKAFSVIFQKGTAVIEKTYSKEKIEKDVKIREYAVLVKENRRTLQEFSNQAGMTKAKNILLSGAAGISLGILGAGLPDVPLFTGMILRGIYETAMQYGYEYESEQERRFILLLIQGALSYGTEFQTVNTQADEYAEHKKLPETSFSDQIDETAAALSKDLLHMKFLQGIPVAGAVGGAYDIVCLKKILDYAQLKYRKRFLTDKTQNLITCHPIF